MKETRLDELVLLELALNDAETGIGVVRWWWWSAIDGEGEGTRSTIRMRCRRGSRPGSGRLRVEFACLLKEWLRICKRFLSVVTLLRPLSRTHLRGQSRKRPSR